MHISKDKAQKGRVYRNASYGKITTVLQVEAEGSGGFYEISQDNSPAFVLDDCGNFVEVEFDLNKDCCWVQSDKAIQPQLFIVEVGRLGE